MLEYVGGKVVGPPWTIASIIIIRYEYNIILSLVHMNKAVVQFEPHTN